jgi:hypothetical protein
MKLPKQNKAYVSDIDQLLAQLNETHPKTNSQKAEIEKAKKIAILRDKKRTDQTVIPA